MSLHSSLCPQGMCGGAADKASCHLCVSLPLSVSGQCKGQDGEFEGYRREEMEMGCASDR